MVLEFTDELPSYSPPSRSDAIHDTSGPSLEVPSYSPTAVSSTIISPSSSATELPSYSPPAIRQPPRGTTVHHCYLLNRSERPWITLRVTKSRSPLSTSSPFYFQGDSIEGSVGLDLNREHVESIYVSVTGSISLGGTQSYRFLEIPTILWSASMGDPNLPPSDHPIRPCNNLHGKYTFPFATTLPDDVAIQLKGEPSQRMFPLPPTFAERDSSTVVQYHITAKVARGKLRGSSKLETTFGYIPLKKPPPCSVLRQIAYLENTPLIGVEDDPDGWHSAKPVIIKGIVFNNRRVDIRCTLSLAKPICYTRGTVIPCIVTMETPDSQALDLLSTPSAINVQLMRRSSDSLIRPSYPETEFVRSVATAVWSPSIKVETNRSSKRVIMGEIVLTKDLAPSCTIFHFSLSYMVAMFPLKCAAFTPSSDEREPLLSEVVEIVAAYADGPRPRITAPPSYQGAFSPTFNLDNLHYGSVRRAGR